MKPAEMGSRDLASAATAKYAIRLQSARDFSAGKGRLLLRGGREITSEGDSEGIREAVRKGGNTTATAKTD